MLSTHDANYIKYDTETLQDIDHERPHHHVDILSDRSNIENYDYLKGSENEHRLAKSASFVFPLSNAKRNSLGSAKASPRERASSLSNESSTFASASFSTLPPSSASSAIATSYLPSLPTKSNARSCHPPLLCPRTPWTSPASSPFVFESSDISGSPIFSGSQSRTPIFGPLSSETLTSTSLYSQESPKVNSTSTSTTSSYSVNTINADSIANLSFLSHSVTAQNFQSTISLKPISHSSNPRTPFPSPASSNLVASTDGHSISRPVSPFALTAPVSSTTHQYPPSASTFFSRGTLSISSTLASSPSGSPTIYPLTPHSSPQPISPILQDFNNISPSGSPARATRTFLSSSRSRTSSPFQVFVATPSQVQFQYNVHSHE